MKPVNMNESRKYFKAHYGIKYIKIVVFFDYISVLTNCLFRQKAIRKAVKCENGVK